MKPKTIVSVLDSLSVSEGCRVDEGLVPCSWVPVGPARRSCRPIESSRRERWRCDSRRTRQAHHSRRTKDPELPASTSFRRCCRAVPSVRSRTTPTVSPPISLLSGRKRGAAAVTGRRAPSRQRSAKP